MNAAHEVDASAQSPLTSHPEGRLRQHILQHMLANTIAVETTMLDFIHSAHPELQMDSSRFTRLMADISDDLRPLHYNLHRVFGPCVGPEFTDQFVWILSLTTLDIGTGPANYTNADIRYLYTVFSHISRREGLSISAVDLLNIALDFSGQRIPMTLPQKESFIKLAVADNWLYSDSHNQISLGIRSIIELSSVLLNNGWFEKCTHCQILAAHSVRRCRSRGCAGCVHAHCLQQLTAANMTAHCHLCGDAFA